MIAIAVTVLALTWGHSSSQDTEAATIGPGTMNFRVKAGSSDCAATAKPTKCSVATGTAFTLAVAVNDYTAGGYAAIQTDISWAPAGITYKPTMPLPDAEFVWPDDSLAVRAILSATRVQHGSPSAGFGAIPSLYKGNVVALAMNCTAGASSTVFSLLPYDPIGNSGGSVIADPAFTPIPQSDTLTINCVAPPPTPTRTNTPIPPTATNTATAVSIPRFQKCTLGSIGTGTCTTLQNLFLTRQGAKIPPLTCTGGTNGASLVEQIHIPIGGVDPKPPFGPRQLGGFSFQVKYNPLKVCVDLNPGPAWTVNPQQICVVEDSISAPTLQGIARISCVTLGKATIVNTSSVVGRILASITVKPQPEAYSQIIANQGNGQVVQLNDEACKLTDLQGHAIAVFSCEDADVTLRLLEGDVEPDCAVNTLDTQAIAFRWGATKGNLIYNDRFNLEPSGTTTARDQDIDVNDLQFVYGRFGSNCATPHPAQNPINAKS